MPMVRAMRLINAVEAGTTSGVQLQALLSADAGRLAEFNVLLGMRGQVRRIASSSTAMAAVLSSSTAKAAVIASATAMAAVAASPAAWATVQSDAGTFNAVISDSTAMTAVAASPAAMAALIANSTNMAAVAANPTAMAAVAADPTAMAAVWASDTATDTVLASATARLAIYNSDIALAALQANPVQVQRKVTSGAVNASTASSTYTFVPNGTKVILLRRYYSKSEADLISWARGSTISGVGNGPSGGGRNLDTGVTALGCVSGTYTSNGLSPTANDSTANFVAAANGLRRREWATGGVLYVSYILVG